MSKRTRSTKKLAAALGATRVEAVSDKSHQGPLGLLAPRDEIATRLRSTGGRPTDPSWTERRCVPFSEETWNHLNELAEKMSAEGRKVTPAQVAAILVEQEIQKLHAA